MREQYLIGVDMGTTLTKAGVFDTEGRVMAKATQENSLI